MKIEWANNGEAFEVDINGEKKLIFSATIDCEDDQPIQKFEGENHKEILDKLLIAQGNATTRIRQLSGKVPVPVEVTPAPKKAPLEIRQRPLSADDRFEIAQDLTDAAKAPEAVVNVIEAELGLPLSEVRERIQADQNREMQERVHACIEQFKQEATDYILCQHNEDLMIKYGELHNYPADDIASYHEIWGALKKAGLAVLTAPEPTEPEPGARPNGGLPENRPTVRPRLASSSTSLRRGDSDDAPSGPTKPKYTRAQIDAMPEEEFTNRLNTEPGFRKFVDALK